MECFGAILLILAVILFFIGRSEDTKARTIGATDTYTAALLHEIHKKVVDAVGGDALAQRCEVTGVIEADMALTAPLSRRQCVAYDVTVTREYEEVVTKTDSDGKKTRSTERGSETMETDSKKVLFWVRDSSGRVRIDPEDGDLDMEETENRFEQSNDPARSGRRTLGMRRVESIIPVGVNVFVIGYARDRNGEVVVGRNPKSGGDLMISRKTERELLASASSSARWMKIGAAASGVIGLIVLAIGLLS